MKTALVTGASTGIGRATAERLADEGWRVLAGVRKPAHADALDAAHEAIHPVFLDVTDADHVAALPDVLAQHGGALHGLVNNAGIAVARPMEVIDLDRLRHQFEVNVFGQVAVTQACLPALREARGRIVNIGSTGSRVTPPWMGPYTASKHALVGVNDAMRQELIRWGIHVVLLEPGAIATPIWDKGKAEVSAFDPEEEADMVALYPDALEKMNAVIHQQASVGIPASDVADVVWTALTARRPRARYPVGRDAQVVTFLGRHLPPRLMDMLVKLGR